MGFTTDSLKTIFSGFHRLKSIRHTDPELTPTNWCNVQPCAEIRAGSKKILITQPTSTFFVYFLGIQTICAGIYFLWIQGNEISRLWWGISLVLWGIGALLAGTSFQAFGYQIKCEGQDYCAWTSWWEVTYLIFQQVSFNTMLVAVAYSCTDGTLRTVLLGYATFCGVLYVITAFVGGFVPIKSLITFELMVGVSVPTFMFFIAINGWRYYTLKNPMDLALLGAWVLLFCSSGAYFIYDVLDITQKLWSRKKRIWFSQNDVLHITLILWIFYIVIVLANRIKDY